MMGAPYLDFEMWDSEGLSPDCAGRHEWGSAFCKIR